MAEMTPEQPTFSVGTDLSDGKLSVVVMKHENGTTWVIHSEVIQLVEQQPELTKYQPCGCVVCTCEHETQCQGCGAKHCGTHPVGQIPEPVYQQPAPDVAGLAASLYQACGAYDMPERILDVLSAAANGEPFEHMIDGLLPCVPPSDQDVAALVDALTELCDEIDKHDIHAAISSTSILWFKRKARAALAAHRKQGGEV